MWISRIGSALKGLSIDSQRRYSPQDAGVSRDQSQMTLSDDGTPLFAGRTRESLSSCDSLRHIGIGSKYLGCG